MKKFLTACCLGLLFSLTVPLGVQAAEQNVFKPEGGGYRIVFPTNSTELYHTTTGVRFLLGKTQLVNADVYTLSNYLAVPRRNYSAQQTADLEKFILNVQDYPDFTMDKGPAKVSNTNVKTPVQPNKANQAVKNAPHTVLNKTLGPKAEPDKRVKPKALVTSPYDDVYNFVLQPPAKVKINRDFVIGKAYQLKNDKLLVIRISSPMSEKAMAKANLNVLTSDLKLSKPKYPEENTLTSALFGYKLNLPTGWHAYTQNADNIIWAKSLSSVHNDEALIRAFKTNEFANFAKADAQGLATEEKAFVEKITKFTPNITVVRHQAVVIDGMNASIVESTDSVDLKKVFIVNAYVFSKDGIAYQIRFNTDDTINYDLKTKSYISAIQSFKRVRNAIPVNRFKK